MNHQYTNEPSSQPTPPPQEKTDKCQNSIWSINGRIGQKDYIISTLITFCIITASAILISINGAIFIPLVSIVLIFWMPLYGGVFPIKRLHDMDRSGYWYSLLPILFIAIITLGIPFQIYAIAFIIMIILLCSIPGTKGKNRYGDVP